MEGDGGCDAPPSTDMLVFGRRQLECEEGLSMSSMGRRTECKAEV